MLKTQMAVLSFGNFPWSGHTVRNLIQDKLHNTSMWSCFIVLSHKNESTNFLQYVARGVLIAQSSVSKWCKTLLYMAGHPVCFLQLD